MKFEEFTKHFIETNRLMREQPNIRFRDNPTFTALIDQFGGATFCRGLYRICDWQQVVDSTTSIEQAFPASHSRIRVFGYDWLGRQFAADYGNIQKGNPHVLLFEIGAGEVMRIPTSLGEFHNSELVEFTNDALAKNFFLEWTKSNPGEIGYSECVGYRVPLFLGGKDVAENLEVIDLAVYLELCGQLLNKTKTLKEGQVIRDVYLAK